MRADFYQLDFPDTNATPGAALPVEEYVHKTVQVSGDFTGLNMHIEGTLDGAEWDALTESITTKDIIAIPETVKKIRVYRTSLTSGDPVVKFAGRLYRE